MRKGTVLIIIITMMIVGCTSTTDSPTDSPNTLPPGPAVYVANNLSETLSAVYPAIGVVDVNALPLGSSPNDIETMGDTAYVVNSLSNNVQVIDLITRQTVGTIEILYGINPYYIAVENLNRAFVTNWMTGNVSVLDLQAGIESDTITIGGVPQGICVTQDRLFVTDINLDMGTFTYGPGHLFAYSLTTLDFIDSIEVGINPQIVRPGPDGKLHVVCTGVIGEGTGEVKIVDPATLTIEQTIPIGGSPGSLAFNSQNIGYLGSVAWFGEGWILTYDAVTYQVINDAQNPIVLPSSAMDIVCAENDHVFAVCFNTDELIELDANNTTIHTYTVGDGPTALAIWE